MFTSQYDPRERIVWVDVRLHGPLGYRDIPFVLDTGSPITVVEPSVMDVLGYGAHMAIRRSRLVGVDGIQDGYALRASRFDALGFQVEQFELSCNDFDERTGVRGLLGMDFLLGRVLTLDGIRGLVLASDEPPG